MPKYIHFIPVGKSSVKVHLAGLVRFKADEVVLFSLQGDDKTMLLVEALRKIGAAYRTVVVGRGYLDSYRKANEEAAACCGEDASLGVNMSTGAEIMGGAIEDGVRIQLHYFHRANEYANCAAYRYYVHDEKKMRFETAPIWNFLLYLHNDIMEVLAESSTSLSMNQILESIKNLNPDEGLGFEAFRKVFRSFKRWFGINPCFNENLKKSPLYKVEL
jgi:hypothetical protein